MDTLDHAAGMVVAQVCVDVKTNGIPMFAVLLDQIPDLEGALITADALCRHRHNASGLGALRIYAWLRRQGRLPEAASRMRSR